MNHAGNLVLVLGFDGQAVAAVAHGNHRILQIGAVGIQNGVQLGVDLVRGQLHGPAHVGEPGAGVVRHLVLAEDTALDLLIQRG